MDIAQALTDASMAADFYQTVAATTDRVGVVGDSIAADLIADTPDDNTTFTYSVHTPYAADRTAHHLVTYPAASGALSPHVVADLLTKLGPLGDGEAYALGTDALDYWPDSPEDPNEDIEPITLGYVVIVSVVAADLLTWEN